MSFSAFLAAIALAQAVPPQAAPTALSDVVVSGQAATREQLTEFITEVGGGPPRRLMARWNRPICIGTANVRREFAEPFIDRIATIATQVGVTVEGPGCRANMLVLFTTDGPGLAKALAQDDPQSFIPNEQRGPLLTRADLDVFVSSDRPVRWWHLSQDVSEATGQPVQLVTVVTPPPDSQEYEIPQVVVSRMGRLGSGMRADLQQGVVIVDTSRLGDTAFSALADYTAMVILAQIDPATTAGNFPSILSLFSEQPRSDALTDWDWSFLRALYQTPPDRPSRRFQEREMAREMLNQFKRQPMLP
jgi:hypothetical protein